MYMFTSTLLSFNIRSCQELWGFEIDVVDRDGEVLETYYLDQSYRLMSNDGGSLEESPNSTWELKRKDDDRYTEPLLTGRLVYGRTDPFSPLMKCLQFLTKQGR